MSATTTLHQFDKARAISSGSTEWLQLSASDGSYVSVFMPLRAAEAMAEAWDDYENWASSQEGPTYDEALGAKCDADERLRSDLTEAGRGHLIK